MDFSFGKESGLLRVIPREKECESCDFEEFCRDLEWMFYELKIPLDTIIRYIHGQLFEPQKPVSGQIRPLGLAQSILGGPQIAPRHLFEQVCEGYGIGLPYVSTMRKRLYIAG